MSNQTLLLRRYVCLSCDTAPGYGLLVITTKEGLLYHREHFPLHFMVRENLPEDDNE